jgi:hypothetical protein
VIRCLPPLHLRTETDPASETSCFYSLEYRTTERVENPVILCVVHHRQNPLEATNHSDLMITHLTFILELRDSTAGERLSWPQCSSSTSLKYYITTLHTAGPLLSMLSPTHNIMHVQPALSHTGQVSLRCVVLWFSWVILPLLTLWSRESEVECRPASVEEYMNSLISNKMYLPFLKILWMK